MNSNDWEALLPLLDGSETPNKRGKLPKRGKREAFYDCVNGRLAARMMYVRQDLSVTGRPLRCQLKNHCPKCMSGANIVHRRGSDFLWMNRVAGLLGGGPNGMDLKVWVVTRGSSERPPSASRLAKALGRSDGRYRPMMIGQWAGEVIVDTPCAELQTTNTSNNGPKLGTSFVFNALLFTGRHGSLDEERLRKWLPGCRIDHFHGCLVLAWESYLTRWSGMRIDSSSVAQVAAWINQGRRGFTAIGALYGKKTKEKDSYLRDLRHERGKIVAVGCISDYEDRGQAKERIRRHLQGTEGWDLFERPLTYSEIEQIMTRIEIELRDIPTTLPTTARGGSAAG
jgi:hypothetical protein